MRLHPDLALDVSIIEAGSALVLRGGGPMGAVHAPYDMTLAFALHDEPGGATRLLVRERHQYKAWWAAFVVEPVELVSLVMSRRVLRGIKRRAEEAGVRDQWL